MITVLTDGECRFCEATMAWVQKKLDVNPIAFQKADLSQYGLTFEQCSKAVHVIHAGKTYAGPDAIAYLLSRRGNWILGFIVRASGPLGRFGDLRANGRAVCSRVAGVIGQSGRSWRAGAVVVTTGTFLKGLIHIGEKRIPAGRVGEQPAIGLSDRLYGLGLQMGRLKTGTPARLRASSID